MITMFPVEAAAHTAELSGLISSNQINKYQKMTRKQIEEAKNSLPRFNNRTSQEKRIADELGCREMINSCLIYCIPTAFYDEATHKFQNYAQRYVKDLGEETVKRLWDEQLVDFSKATVSFNVYTDSEGGTYNSCIWDDERN